MKDTRILLGIINNEEQTWKYLYSDIKPAFASTLTRLFPSADLRDCIDDIFQETCVILMCKAKEGKLTITREGALYSYIVQIGKLLTHNKIRKNRTLTAEEIATLNINLHDDSTDVDMKQREQDAFLDRVFDSIHSECKLLLKLFYWDKKSMDDIASILGMRNADSAKTKKNKCMNKFKDIAAKLIENDEYAEEVVRAAVERAALRELLKEESISAASGVKTAALDVEEKPSDN